MKTENTLIEKQGNAVYNVLGTIITGKCMDDSYIHKGEVVRVWDCGTVTIKCGEDCPKKTNYPDRFHGEYAIIYKDNIIGASNNCT